MFDVPRNGATLKMQIGPYREPTQPAGAAVGSLPFPRGLFQYRLLRDAFIPHGVPFLLVYRGRGPQACHKLQLCYKLRVVPSFLLQRARLSCFASSCLAGVTNASQTSSLGSWLIYQGGVVHASTLISYSIYGEKAREQMFIPYVRGRMVLNTTSYSVVH